MTEASGFARIPRNIPHNYTPEKTSSNTGALFSDPFVRTKKGLETASMKERKVKQQKQGDAKTEHAFRMFAPKGLPPTRPNWTG